MFSVPLNTVSEDAAVTLAGRLFHARGTVTRNGWFLSFLLV